MYLALRALRLERGPCTPVWRSVHQLAADDVRVPDGARMDIKRDGVTLDDDTRVATRHSRTRCCNPRPN